MAFLSTEEDREMDDENVELGNISLVYERDNKRVEMYVSEEPPWTEHLRTYFEFLRAVGFFINPDVDGTAIKAAWETHHKSFSRGEE